MSKDIEIQIIIDANEIIKELRELKNTVGEHESTAKYEIDKIINNVDSKKEIIEESIKELKGRLLLYCKSMNMKESKTMRKKVLLDGTIQIKKATEKMVVDDEKLMKWARDHKPELIATKEVSKVKWSELKENLVIADGSIIDKISGEIIDKEVIGIVKESEKLEIKF